MNSINRVPIRLYCSRGLAARVWMCKRSMCARSMQVSQEAARAVMNYIDFRAAIECPFFSQQHYQNRETI